MRVSGGLLEGICIRIWIYIALDLPWKWEVGFRNCIILNLRETPDGRLHVHLRVNKRISLLTDQKQIRVYTG